MKGFPSTDYSGLEVRTFIAVAHRYVLTNLHKLLREEFFLKFYIG